MSVFISSFISHHCSGFSRSFIEQVARTAVAEGGTTEWRRLGSESPESEFKKDGWVSFRLPGGYTLKFSRRFLSLNYDKRWSALLTLKDVRRAFLSTCKRTAIAVGASEILLLPQGTKIEDLLSQDIDFPGVKQHARRYWGPPDLDISHIYSESEVSLLAAGRVHYFILSLTDLSAFT